VSFALTPTRIFYGDSNHGAVKSVDLATGRTTTVFRRPGGKFAQVDVVAIGNRVAWDMTINPTRQLDGMRTVPSGSVVRLPYSPYAMTAAGVVMKSVDPSNHELTDVWFLPFGGSVHRLMSARMFDELPQLVGHALAWVSVDGNLKVAPYKY
jgi:hypothetical protein